MQLRHPPQTQHGAGEAQEGQHDVLDHDEEQGGPGRVGHGGPHRGPGVLCSQLQTIIKVMDG